MKRYATIAFLVILVGLLVSGVYSCSGKDKKKIYFPPDTGTGTGTGTGTDTGTGTGTDTGTGTPSDLLVWAKSAGGWADDMGFGISALSDGTALVTGGFAGSATFGPGEGNQADLTSAGDNDIFIARYNPDGTLNWAKSAGGAGSDFSYDISALSDGSAVVTGWFSVTATFGAGEGNQTDLTSAGDNDIFIAKYNPDGTLAWAKRAGGAGAGNDVGHGISVLSDGSALVTGYFLDTAATFGNALEGGNETVLTSAGVYFDIFVARYNPDGTLNWAKRAGDTLSDYGYDISALSDGSAMVTGQFTDSATFGNASEGNEITLISAGSYDIFVAKYNPDGTLNWAKSAGGVSSTERSCGISALSDGSALVTGRFGSTAVFGLGEGNQTSLATAGGEDIFVAKYNPDGTLNWAKRAGGAYSDVGWGISAFSDGSAIVSGWFSGTATLTATFGAGDGNETDLTTAGGNDIFIAKYNPDGTLAWARSAGGGSDDLGRGIVALSDGSAIATGGFGGMDGNSATFGAGETYETVLVSSGLFDFYIAKFSP